MMLSQRCDNISTVHQYIRFENMSRYLNDDALKSRSLFSFVCICFFLFTGNTVSNLIMILPPIYGALQTFKNGLEVRYALSFLGLAGKRVTKALKGSYRVFKNLFIFFLKS